jgi:hypothetical protein
MPDTTSDRNDEELNPQHQRYASPPRTGHRKRGRYIGNACSACQKRKVKVRISTNLGRSELGAITQLYS